MRYVGIPYEHFVAVASFLLRGEGLAYWKEYVDAHGYADGWHDFQMIMREGFDTTAKLTQWNKTVRVFAQRAGETGKEYTVRFFREIVAQCPRPLLEAEAIQRYIDGLRYNYRFLEPTPRFRNFHELTQVVEAIDKHEPFLRPPTIRDFPSGCGPSTSTQAGPSGVGQAAEDPEEEPEEEEDPEEESEEEEDQEEDEDPEEDPDEDSGPEEP